MNNLCAEIGYKSVNHVGEQLCGDHVDIVNQGDESKDHRDRAYVQHDL